MGQLESRLRFAAVLPILQSCSVISLSVLLVSLHSGRSFLWNIAAGCTAP